MKAIFSGDFIKMVVGVSFEYSGGIVAGVDVVPNNSEFRTWRRWRQSREALSISSPSRNLILKEKSQLSGLLKVNGMNFRRLEPALSMKISLREFLSSPALMSQSLLQSQ